MKIKLLFLGAVASMATAMSAGSFDINGTAYNYDLLEQKEIGPGVIYHRIRIPDYPLNINYMTVDLTNPYNSVETTQANERLFGTEACRPKCTPEESYQRMAAHFLKMFPYADENFLNHILK